MELRHLRYFTAVAEERNFTRAADRLRIAQPSLSQQIRQLEQVLGAVLIDRSMRPLTLTPAGQRLLTDAYAVLGRVDATMGAIQRIAAGETGELRVGYAYGGLYQAVLDLVLTFHDRRPDVGLVLRQLSADEQIRAVRDGSVDVAVTRIVRPLEGMSDLAVWHLGRERMLVMLSASHPLAGRAEVPLRHLAGESFVLFPARLEPMITARYLGACRTAGFTPRITYEIEDAQSQALTVAARLAVALTGAGLALRFPGVAYLPISPPTHVTDLAVVHSTARKNPLIDVFLAGLTGRDHDIVPTEPRLLG